MKSLRTQLLFGLLGAVVLVGVAGGTGLYLRALAEADIVFDEHLRQTALALRDRSFYGRAAEPLNSEDVAADLVVQVWSLDGLRVYLSRRHAVVPGLTRLGYSTVDTDEGVWRVYGVQTPYNFIQVAQPQRIREARAAQLALHLLLPFAVVLPLLALLIWFIVGRALRPLRQLAGDVGARQAGVLQPLATAGLPGEVRPLVTALNELLLSLDRLRSRERAFIADAAHELRTPLTALRLQLHALAAADDAERSEAVVHLGAGIERASRLVEQMLALARQDQAPETLRQDTRLDELAREVIAELMPLADLRQIDLGIVEAEALTLSVDAEALRTLLRNLIDNALRYTPAGGRVDLALRREGQCALLEVCDNGPGIPPEEHARIFDRFYRAPGHNGSGSGLGLAIVKAIADAHGAEVTLGAGAGERGLRVSLRLPYRLVGPRLPVG